MRLFIAIPLSHRVRSELAGVQLQMKKQGYQGNFTRKENLHMTLAFLGEREDVDEIAEVMRSVPIPEIRLDFTKIGSFGNILWVGMRDNEVLDRYVQDLREALTAHHIDYDPKPFKSHVTLSRKTSCPKDNSIQLPHISMTVERIVLMSSERDDAGKLVYRDVKDHQRSY